MIVVLLTKAVPLSVALTPDVLSVNVIVMSVLYVFPLLAPENVGGILSIRVMVSMRERSVRVFDGENHAHVVYGPVPQR